MRPSSHLLHSQPRSRAGLAALGIALIAILGAVVWVQTRAPVSIIEPPAPLTASPESSLPATAPGAATAAPERVPAEAERPTPLAELERTFVAAVAKEDRIELARKIATRNDAEAVSALGRLFQNETQPEVKVALLVNLKAIPASAGPDARMQILANALRGQSREVRTTALDSLAQLDDPRASGLILVAMRSDPDQEVREMAAALERARMEKAR
jgi:hypothetical protein